MTAQKTNQHEETPATATERPAAAKKTFVEPAISQPVDGLEATTYFQVVDSGGTGIKKRGD